VAPMKPDAPSSVHLAPWPAPGPVDDEIVAQMDVVRRAVELGRQARASAKIKMRQPLSAAYIRASSKYSDAALRRFRALVLDELNVKDVQVVGIDASFIEYALRPNLPRLGPRFGKDLGALRKAIAAADPRAVAVAAAGGKGFEVSTDGKKFALEPDDVLVDSKSAQGFAFAEGDGMLVALDARLDEALELEGWAREIVRAVQDARKAAGFDVSDRIALTVVADGEQHKAAVQWKNYIVEQTLATSWSLERGPFAVTVSKA
jgi:isoleucyl-tRNA synthetase